MDVKIFGGEILIRTLSIILLQMFCKNHSQFKVIVKSIIDPDDRQHSSAYHLPIEMAAASTADNA